MSEKPVSEKPPGTGGGHGHGKHGALAMLLCCIPMVAVLVLIGLKVI